MLAQERSKQHTAVRQNSRPTPSPFPTACQRSSKRGECQVIGKGQGAPNKKKVGPPLGGARVTTRKKRPQQTHEQPGQQQNDCG